MASKSRDQKISRIGKMITDIEEVPDYLKILVYGKNGKGKTRFAASAPKCLLIDINEKGTRSARSFTDTRVLHITKWEDLVYAKWYLKERDHDFESVAIDNLTQLQGICMTQVLKEGVERDPNRDPKMPAQRDWGKMTELLKKEIYDFRNLPMHVIFLAQERTIDDEEGMIEEVTLDMSRGNRNVVTGAVEIIGRIYKKKVRVGNKRSGKETTKWETRLYVGDHEDLITKDRSGALGNVIRDPSVPKILKLISDNEE